jgi:hypothetical protein
VACSHELPTFQAQSALPLLSSDQTDRNGDPLHHRILQLISVGPRPANNEGERLTLLYLIVRIRQYRAIHLSGHPPFWSPRAT